MLPVGSEPTERRLFPTNRCADGLSAAHRMFRSGLRRRRDALIAACAGAWPRRCGPVLSAGQARPGSAGRPPEQLLDTAPLAFGRTACAAIAHSHRGSFLARRAGRAVVGIALGGSRRADPLGDDPHDDHDAFVPVLAQPHFVTSPDRMRGLDPHPVDPDVPAPAGAGCGRSGPGQPHRPDPAVHPSRQITCHSATVMRTRSPVSVPAGMPGPASLRRLRAYSCRNTCILDTEMPAWPSQCHDKTHARSAVRCSHYL